ncbi:unnamed protein product [Arctogadus glacialis]
MSEAALSNPARNTTRTRLTDYQPLLALHTSECEPHSEPPLLHVTSTSATRTPPRGRASRTPGGGGGDHDHDHDHAASITPSARQPRASGASGHRGPGRIDTPLRSRGRAQRVPRSPRARADRYPAEEPGTSPARPPVTEGPGGSIPR